LQPPLLIARSCGQHSCERRRRPRGRNIIGCFFMAIILSCCYSAVLFPNAAGINVF